MTNIPDGFPPSGSCSSLTHQGPLRLKTISDILEYVPHALGYLPDQSIVVLFARGSGVGPCLRIELPEYDAAAPERQHRRMTKQLRYFAQQLRDSYRMTSSFVMCYDYSDHKDRDRLTVLPHQDLVDECAGTLRSGGYAVARTLLVSSDSWMDYVSSDTPSRGQPEERRAKGVKGTSPIGPELVLRGYPKPRLRAEVSAIPSVAQNLQEDVMAKVRVVQSASGELSGRMRLLQGWVLAVNSLTYNPDIAWKSAEISRELMAVCIAALQEVTVRDAALAVSIGEQTAAERIVQNRLPTRERVVSRVCGGGAAPPDRYRLEATESLVRSLVGYCDVALRAPLFTVLAWSYWCRGLSSISGDFLGKALSIDPQYTLARLLFKAVLAGLMPEWILSPLRTHR